MSEYFGQQGVAIALITAEDTSILTHGFADTALKLKVTKDTLFEIGSVSKPVTAFAFAEPVATHKIDIHKPVISQISIQDLATEDTVLANITLAELMSHSSGLPRLPTNMPLDDLTDPYATYTKDMLFNDLANVSLGEKTFSYSNYGFGVVSTLAEIYFKASYPDLMQKRVFEPLGMKTAAIAVPNKVPEALASGYDISLEQVSNWHFDALAGAGSVIASIQDMKTMVQSILHKEDTTLAIQTWVNLATNEDSSMTMGWMRHGEDWLWHAGQTAGFCAFVAFNKEKQLGIVILTNVAKNITSAGFSIAKQMEEKY
ncbi:serine hydrolase domain-containing protein [Glaciecola sp. 1036]|uniref:serine hydrolase domain-containing protein n=1 Tax=Alteromonadaceae TaxID=72275 RepID=UPI003D047A46